MRSHLAFKHSRKTPWGGIVIQLRTNGGRPDHLIHDLVVEEAWKLALARIIKDRLKS